MVARFSRSLDLSRMISAFEGFVFESFASSALWEALDELLRCGDDWGGGGGHVVLKGLTRLPIC